MDAARLMRCASTCALLALTTSPRPARAQATGAHSALAAYNVAGKDPVQFELEKPLREISGLAINAQGHIFAHQDERALVFRLDPANGRVTESFRVGHNGVSGDFEGIAIAGRRFFLVSSNGTLLEFAEGQDDASVEYQRTNLGTRSQCTEIEGLEYDARREELLLACKIPEHKLRDRLLVLAWSLRTKALLPEPRFSIPLDDLKEKGEPAKLNPSGIAIHPITGTIFLVASEQGLLVELDPAGHVLGVAELRRKTHPQPEGITFAPDGTLYISDEGRSGHGQLSVYPPDRAKLPGRAGSGGRGVPN